VLLAVPNFSEGRDAAVIAALRAALGPLDVHTDPDHNRSVFTLRADLDRLLAAARVAIDRIDLRAHAGVHPRVGAMDVAPIVHTTPGERGAAVAMALVLGEELGRLGLPVHLYGVFGRPRAVVRKDPGRADFGPQEAHPTAGRTLVTARPPLVAFNVIVDATVEEAKAIAAGVRRLPGVVALGVPTAMGVQVTTNLEGETTPAQLTAAVAAHAPVLGTELVGLAPRGTMFPPGTAARFID
jgi:glutamate formiminotransferase